MFEDDSEFKQQEPLHKQDVFIDNPNPKGLVRAFSYEEWDGDSAYHSPQEFKDNGRSTIKICVPQIHIGEFMKRFDGDGFVSRNRTAPDHVLGEIWVNPSNIHMVAKRMLDTGLIDEAFANLITRQHHQPFYRSRVNPDWNSPITMIEFHGVKLGETDSEGELIVSTSSLAMTFGRLSELLGGESIPSADEHQHRVLVRDTDLRQAILLLKENGFISSDYSYDVCCNNRILPTKVGVIPTSPVMPPFTERSFSAKDTSPIRRMVISSDGVVSMIAFDTLEPERLKAQLNKLEIPYFQEPVESWGAYIGRGAGMFGSKIFIIRSQPAEEALIDVLMKELNRAGLISTDFLASINSGRKSPDKPGTGRG